MQEVVSVVESLALAEAEAPPQILTMEEVLWDNNQLRIQLRRKEAEISILWEGVAKMREIAVSLIQSFAHNKEVGPFFALMRDTSKLDKAIDDRVENPVSVWDKQ